jgi:hypothetical protein
MAAKSRKVSVKNKQVKKSSGAKKQATKVSSGRAKAKSVELEVVPNLMSPEMSKHLTKVEDFVRNSTHMTDTELARGINTYSKQASAFALDAVKSGTTALVYAWACGRLLNAAKEKFGRGGFGKWRADYLEPGVISERTSQRYMQLAAKNQEVRPLLEWSPSLRQAYIACGVLPEPPERETGDEEDTESSKRQELLSSITGIQKKLRLFSGLKGKLGAAEKNQLKLAKMEIDRFFDEILG